MVQGYYTLQEAAQVLALGVDELKQMAQKNQIRSFQDRGTLRFRIQDIQELQRQRLGDSDPEMVLGDSISPKPVRGEDPKSGSLKTPKPTSAAKAAEVFDFDLDDSVDVGGDLLDLGGSAARKAGPKSGQKLAKHGSDSDVKLQADGSDSFTLQLGDNPPSSSGDSDVRLGDLATNKKSSGASSRKSGIARRSKLGPSPADSGVRLVPMSNDTPASTDSDIRLGKAPAHRAAENMVNTEEIDLDQEMSAAAAPKSTPRFKTNPSKLGKPPSPFELSDSDIDDKVGDSGSSDDFDIVAPAPKSSPKLAPKSGKKKKGTDFELTPEGSDEDFSLELDDDSLDLGGDVGADFDGPKSGINLSRPIDQGISLEGDGGEAEEPVDFELNLEGAPPTPKPHKKQEVDSDSEFELSLDDSSAESPALKEDSADSEFELSLGDGGGTSTESEGDFELALDDDEPAPKPAGKKKKAGAETEEQDIFETDFELPAMGDEGDSGDETVDGGSSDFELALDDSDIAVEDESGSQVVALDEEELDGGETFDGDLDEADIDEEAEVDDEEVEVREKVVVQEVVRDRWIKPAPWGVLPVVFMLPCVIVMVLVGIMGWELVQSSSGFRSAGLLTRSMADMMGVKMK